MNTQTQAQTKTPKPVPEFVRLMKIEDQRRAEKARQNAPQSPEPSTPRVWEPPWMFRITLFGHCLQFSTRQPEPILPNPPGSSQYRNFLKHAERGGLFNALTGFVWDKLCGHEIYYDENGTMYGRATIYIDK